MSCGQLPASGWRYVDRGSVSERVFCLAGSRPTALKQNHKQHSGVLFNSNYTMNGHQATLNDDPMNKSKEFNNGNAKVLNWNSTVQNWNECAEEMRRNSGTSSGEESPPSDIPASSSISNTPNVFEAFLSAIDKNEIVERPDLETQLKIMSWLCGVDESRMVSGSVCVPLY
ncbi:unnamed protein product [Toxocara canis]|uniref:Uncharacterized protein n=1 Tax=Toxocara canis TaxID=6265 RepID=A0A183UMW9_TOXCA|nr:unnamed protein product [Toxocara canis]